MHTEIHTQIGSIITIKKRENIPKTFFIHFLCNAKHRQQNTAMRHWRKKTFQCKNFSNKLPEATTTKSNVEYVNNNDIFISIFFMFPSH